MDSTQFAIFVLIIMTVTVTISYLIGISEGRNRFDKELENRSNLLGLREYYDTIRGNGGS